MNSNELASASGIRSRLWFSAILALFAAVIVLEWCRTDRQPLLAVGLDIGDILLEDSPFKHKIALRNQSDSDIHITDFSTSCTCTEIEPTDIIIPRGEAREFNLQFDLSRLYRNSANDTRPAPFAVSFAPLSEQLPSQFRGWTIRGRIKPALSLEPPSLDFGEVRSDQSIKPLTIKVRALIPAERIWAEVPPHTGNVDAISRSDQSAVFSFSPKPIGKAGRAALPITVWLKAKNGIEYRALYAVTGVVLDNIEIVPPKLLLGNVEIGTSIDAIFSIRLQNPSRRIEAVTIATTGGGTVPEAALFHENDSTYRIRVPIAKTGEASDRIVLAIRIEGKDAVETRTVELGYYGYQTRADLGSK